MLTAGQYPSGESDYGVDFEEDEEEGGGGDFGAEERRGAAALAQALLGAPMPQEPPEIVKAREGYRRAYERLAGIKEATQFERSLPMIAAGLAMMGQRRGAAGLAAWSQALQAQRKEDLQRALLDFKIAQGEGAYWQKEREYQLNAPLKQAQTTAELQKIERAKRINDLLMRELGMGVETPQPASPTAAPAERMPFGDFAQRIFAAESNNNPNARNQNSTATGPAQFIRETWLNTVKGANPEWAQGKTDDELLALRTNPEYSGQMATAYADKNSLALSRADLPVTDGNLYLAHFLGPQGAIKTLTADPNTPMSQIVDKAAVAKNPILQRTTAGELKEWAEGKMGGQAQPRPVQVAQAGGDSFRRGLALEAAGLRGAAGAAYKQGEPTTTERNARAAGLVPGTPEYAQFIKDATLARSQVNIDQRQASEYEKKMGALMADEFMDLQKTGRATLMSDAQLDRMESLMEGLNTGKYTNSILELKRAAKAAGIDLATYGITDDVAPLEAARALSNAIALELRNPSGGAGMPGALSDSDREFLKSMTPGIETTPEGRKLMIETRRRLNKVNREVAELARKYERKNGRFDSGFYQELEEWSKGRNVFGDLAKKSETLSGPQSIKQMSDDDLLKALGVK